MRTKIKNHIKEKHPRLYGRIKAVLVPRAFSYRSDLVMHVYILFCLVLRTLHLDFLSKRMRGIVEVKNRHKNDRCFIIGTGPSLLISDLEVLQSEYTFSMNTIYLLFQYTTWRPTYYVFIDAYGYKELASRHRVNCGAIPLREAFLHYRIKPEKPTGKERYCLIHYGNHTIKRMKKHEIKKSEDISICIYDAFTVTNMAIDIAIYMGFKEIILLGVDCNYKGQKMHVVESFMDKEKKKMKNNMELEVEYMIRGYKRTKSYAESKGVKIYNATRGGDLEVFERINLDDIILEKKSRA